MCYADFCDDTTASTIFARARTGKAASPDDHARFATHVMLAVGRMDAKRGGTMQLH